MERFTKNLDLPGWKEFSNGWYQLRNQETLPWVVPSQVPAFRLEKTWQGQSDPCGEAHNKVPPHRQEPVAGNEFQDLRGPWLRSANQIFSLQPSSLVFLDWVLICNWLVRI